MKKQEQNRKNQPWRHAGGPSWQHTDGHCSPGPEKLVAQAKLWLSHFHAGPGVRALGSPPYLLEASSIPWGNYCCPCFMGSVGEEVAQGQLQRKNLVQTG